MASAHSSAHLPIGVFDSGFGGISVLRVLAQRFPQEDFLFFGDSAHAPYGVRSPNEIKALTLASAQAMHRIGIKALVVACNTATGAALDTLQRELPIPVVGIQPALRLAQTLRKDGQVLVMATPATLSTPTYKNLAHQYGERTIHLPCPGLMDFVERGELSGEKLHAFLKNLLTRYRDNAVDVVVLGCTHYPLLAHAIQPFYPDAALIDGSSETAEQLAQALAAQHLASPATASGHITFLSSAGLDMAQRMSNLYQEALAQR